MRQINTAWLGATTLSIACRETRFWLTAAAVAGLLMSNAAAEVVKAPTAIDASWVGFYLGVHGGYGWKQDDFSQFEVGFPGQSPPPSINGVGSKGAVYGTQAGYNWQFGRIVTGLEFDFSATDIKGSNGVNQTVVVPGVGSGSFSETLGENVKYLGSARARVGWLPTTNVLIFGTVGLAWERLDQTDVRSETITVTGQPSVSSFSSNRFPTDKFGWVAGLGAEVMLGSPNWIARLEYLHYDFGQVMSANSSTAPGATPEISTAGSQTIDIVRAGVSYKFGDPARPAAVAYAKAPVASSVSPWAGFYFGAHGGYGWGDDPFSAPETEFLGSVSNGTVGGTKSTGWVGGGQMGHNWQYGGFVTGLEIDLSAANITGSSNTASSVDPRAGTVFSTGFEEKVKYLGTMRGRLGWLPTENILIYGTAGLAWERFERNETDTTTTATGTTIGRFVSPSDRFGWVAGVGGEMMLGNSNWIGRLEYLHYDFGRAHFDGSFNGNFAPQASAGTITAGHQTIDVLRAGVSYKFGPEAAAAAPPAMYAKAPRVPVQSWAGFYLGAHGGYGWEDNDFSTNFSFNGVSFVGGIRSQGWLGGGQAGYNWQYAKAVAGLEIDGTASGIKGSSTPVTSANDGTATLSDNVKYLGTARGRLGWAPAGNWLLYGTGGLAWERVNRTFDDVNTLQGTRFVSETPRDHFGWVVGVGVETFIGNSNWIARLEYLHYDFGDAEGSVVQTSNDPGTPSFADRSGHQTIETVRAGVSYKFTP